MTEIVATVYEFLGGYSDGLSMFLFGKDQSCEFTGTNYYTLLGYGLPLFALVMAALYYYAINDVRFNRGWHWAAWMLLGAVLVFIGTFTPVYNSLEAGLVCQDEGAPFSGFDVFLYGMFSMAVFALLFTLCSLVLKKWSTNCSTTPF